MDILEYTQHFIFGDTRYPTGGRYGPLQKANLNLFILLEGRCTVENDNNTYHYDVGEAGFSFTHDSLTITYPAGIRSRVIWCQTVDLTFDKKSLKRLHTLPYKFEPSKDLQMLLAMGANLDRNAISERFKNSIAESVFNEYFYLANISETENLFPHLVNKTKIYIDTHYREFCNLDTIATTVGVNKKYLSRLFKQHMGITPIKYLWNMRETHAMQLLLNTTIPISELSYQSGFKNTYHFSNYMKRKYGRYPTEIRKLQENKIPLPEEINAALIKTF